MSKRRLFETTKGTALAVQALRRVLPGGEITWAELTSVLGVSAQGDGRGAIYSARHMLHREGFVFRAVEGVGLTRLTDSQVAEAIVALFESKPA